MRFPQKRFEAKIPLAIELLAGMVCDESIDSVPYFLQLSLFGLRLHPLSQDSHTLFALSEWDAGC